MTKKTLNKFSDMMKFNILMKNYQTITGEAFLGR